MGRGRGTRSRYLTLVGVCGIVTGLLLASVLLVRFYPYMLSFTTFPRLTHTASGVAGDPINLILIGSQAQIMQTFERVGWLIPDPITPQTTARIAADSLAHRSYPTAPVSNLYAFGRSQDLAFEKPTQDVQNRGHVRLWNTATRIDGEQVWIGQASYDSGIELSSSTHFPTHHILPTVDVERRSVGADIEATGLVKSETEVAYATPIFAARNGGGDFYASDGDALVVNLSEAPVPVSQPAWLVGGLKIGVFLLYDALLGVVSGGGAQLAFLVVLVMGSLVIAGVVLWRRLRHRQAT
jgi:hypothetical protein